MQENNALEMQENEQYFFKILEMSKKLRELSFSQADPPFNHSEIRMINEILFAKMRGERLISTQIAKKIGLTRSAVSQMVNRLEERNIVRRVADDVDRKIAYIELSDFALEKYADERNFYSQFVQNLIAEFGKEKLDKLLELFDNFIQTVSTIKNGVN